ncbi:uncharacterized protein LOC110854872 [Folsomia candida]|uniref:uncharacterized protein LOC110854872 n=1 Tax=Folsomia candida TaxID=158441 RepID=UPI000B900A6B|nr:uncharacterized protein LOC110854872 [Folsomia candida]XP_035712783.1 uncharacterized protein LOC110854872 [Folsomia candida]XP_035712787.1 uncharacterized protein LOC110854872 [Folsomia candida]
MKRSALGQSLQGGVSVTVDSEDCDSSFEDTAEPKAKKRKYSENTSWNKFFESKRKDFVTLFPIVVRQVPHKPSCAKSFSVRSPSPVRSSPTDDYEIEEFDSPEKIISELDLNQNTEESSNQLTIGAGRKKEKRRLGEELKAIITKYDNSVRKFPQEYYLNKYDENQSITLVIRHVCGRENKLIWAICRLVERGEDRCVMFRPFYLPDVSVGAVLKLYQPWEEVDIPGIPMPVMICTDFHRFPIRTDNNFGVSEDMLRELVESLPVPFKSSYIKATADCDLQSLLSRVIPFHLKNPNTIFKQTSLMQPSIDLNAIIYRLSYPALTPTSLILSKNNLLVCDSDHLFSVLQLSEFESEKREHVSQSLRPGNYIQFRKLGVVSKTSILEDFSLFPIFQLLESNQRVFYTLCFRHDTEWKQEMELDFPYRPILRKCKSQ